MSLVARKPVFRVFWPGKTQTGLLSSSLKSLDLEDIGIILSRQPTTKVLIRLHRCAGSSVPLLFAYGIRQVFRWQGSYCISKTVMCRLGWAFSVRQSVTFSYEPGHEKMCLMRTTKAQISLRICAVWSAPFVVRCLESIIFLDSIAEISRL